jgi:single-strand DNA-binding protein
MAFCKIMLIGNLGRDPEMRYTPAGKPVTQFSVAVSHSRPDGQGGWLDEGTDWYRVSVFGDRAERVADQLRKGNKVFVEGRFKTREFEGKDGEKRLSLDVISDNVISLERRGGRDDDAAFAGVPAGSASAGASRPPADDSDLDDLPF